MDTQLTPAEIQNINQLLQDYAPARNALSILNETNGNLEKSYGQNNMAIRNLATPNSGNPPSPSSDKNSAAKTS